MKIRKLALFCMGALMISSLSAESRNLEKVKSLVNSDYYDELVKKGNVSVITDNGSDKLVLLPESIYSNQVKEKVVPKEKGNFPFTYETLYLMNKAEFLKANNSSAETIDIKDVSKVCRSVSKMQGLTYYSTTRKKEVVLYEKAYMIESADSMDPIPDLNTGSADGQVSYCLQDDNSFGVCRYKLNYFESDKEMLCLFENLDILGLGPFKAVYPGKLIIKILVIDCDEDVLLYIGCDLDSVKYPGIKGQITDSMVSRIEALYKWVSKQF